MIKVFHIFIFTLLVCASSYGEVVQEQLVSKINPLSVNIPEVELKTTVEKTNGLVFSDRIIKNVPVQIQSGMYRVSQLGLRTVYHIIQNDILVVDADEMENKGTRGSFVSTVNVKRIWKHSWRPLEFWNVMLVAPHASFNSSIIEGSNFFLSRKCRLLEVYERQMNGDDEVNFVVITVEMHPYPVVYSETYPLYKSPIYTRSVPTKDEIHDLKMDILFSKLNLNWIIERKNPFIKNR